jgi:hypothetical protein
MTAIESPKVAASAAMLTTKELATRWGISPGSLANDRAMGRSALPYVKIGDRVRYRLTDVLRFEECALHADRLAR